MGWINRFSSSSRPWLREKPLVRRFDDAEAETSRVRPQITTSLRETCRPLCHHADMGYKLATLLDSATLGWWHRRRARALQKQGQLDCSFRILDGEQVGLTRRWSQGRARLAAGRIDFSPRSLRRSRSGSVAIEVTALGRHAWRHVGLGEAVRHQPLAGVRHVGVIKTPTATLEWGVWESQRRWATETVAPEVSGPLRGG